MSGMSTQPLDRSPPSPPVAGIQNKANFLFHQPWFFNGFWVERSQIPLSVRGEIVKRWGNGFWMTRNPQMAVTVPLTSQVSSRGFFNCLPEEAVQQAHLISYTAFPTNFFQLTSGNKSWWYNGKDGGKTKPKIDQNPGAKISREKKTAGMRAVLPDSIIITQIEQPRT